MPISYSSRHYKISEMSQVWRMSLETILSLRRKGVSSILNSKHQTVNSEASQQETMNPSAIKRNKIQINHGANEKDLKKKQIVRRHWLKTLFSPRSRCICVGCVVTDLIIISTARRLCTKFDTVSHFRGSISMLDHRTHTYRKTAPTTQFIRKVAHYTISQRWIRAGLKPTDQWPYHIQNLQTFLTFEIFAKYLFCYCATLEIFQAGSRQGRETQKNK